MHVCLASPRDRSRVAAACLLLCALAGASCRRGTPATSEVLVDWTMVPTPAVAGSTTRVALTLRDGERHPVRGAILQLAAHMSHPGMSPVVVPLAERGSGVYDVTLQFTMGGDWVLLVTGVLPDGRGVNQRIDLPPVRPAG